MFYEYNLTLCIKSVYRFEMFNYLEMEIFCIFDSHEFNTYTSLGTEF